METNAAVAETVSSSPIGRDQERKAFDETKAGVKGLVDAGVTKIPRIFLRPKENDTTVDVDETTRDPSFSIPVIDLQGVVGKGDPILLEEIVGKIRDASETFGFFHVVNHGISTGVLDEMLCGVRRFFEQDSEVKKQFYTRDMTRNFVYNSNFDLFSAPAANWRDTFFCFMAPNPPAPEDLPATCRDIVMEYSDHVMKLGQQLLGLLSLALGLVSDRLIDMGCAKGLAFLGHYYPPCPEPQLTFGTSKHADDGFLTVLLQDYDIGGLQILYQNRWIDIPPVPGALTINIGDMLQLISNDKFKSVEHRVLANGKGRPRVSVACFFSTSVRPSSMVYGPIQELISEENPAKYREATVQEYVSYVMSKGLDGISPLLRYKIM